MLKRSVDEWNEHRNRNWNFVPDMQYANLQGADLQYADLQGANIDFSCLPIWCGGLNVKLCEKNAKLIGFFGMHYALQHYKGEVPQEFRDWLNSHHRVEETGKL